eukprot:Lithocolla_globosa_v1_NODE_3414_length_1678_cov_90.325940.p1 type:complete len:344 gc:universal NODE_3414_length_1678_cov_90.325940:1203-172(-)
MTGETISDNWTKTSKMEVFDEDDRFTLPRYVLFAVYTLFAFVVFLLLIQLVCSARPKRWQTLFHLLVLLGCLGRAVFFFAVAETRYRYCVVGLVEVFPSFFFFSAYFVLIFLWGQLYSSHAGDTTAVTPDTTFTFRKYLLVNFAFYFPLIVFSILDMTYCFLNETEDPYEVQATLWGYIIGLYAVLFYFIIALAFMWLGFKLYARFKSVPYASVNDPFIGSDSMFFLSTRPIFKLLVFTVFFCGFFALRACLVLFNIIYWPIRETWYWDPIYYFVFEILPLIFMFVVFQTNLKYSPPILKEKTSYGTRDYSRTQSIPYMAGSLHEQYSSSASQATNKTESSKT